MSVIVFDNYTRLIPKTTHHFQKDFHSIVHQIYDPELFDYEVHTLSDTDAPDATVFTTLQECKMLDDLGVFYRIGGLYDDRETRGDEPEDGENRVGEDVPAVVGLVHDAIRAVQRFCKLPKSKSGNADKKGPTNTIGGGSGGAWRFPLPECTRQPPSTTPMCGLRPEPEITSDGDVLQMGRVGDVTGYRFHDKSNFYDTHMLGVVDNKADVSKQTTYDIYHNTAEDTLAYFPVTRAYKSYKDTLCSVFSELKLLGNIYVVSSADIVRVIRENPDKPATDVWETLQSECNITLSGDMYPTIERVEATLRRNYILSSDRSESISFKELQWAMLTHIYGPDSAPTEATRRAMKRILPNVLRGCGLDKKRMAGGIHWYGVALKPKPAEVLPAPISSNSIESIRKMREEELCL